jgi:hypothetical protein
MGAEAVGDRVARERRASLSESQRSLYLENAAVQKTVFHVAHASSRRRRFCKAVAGQGGWSS